MSRWFRLYDEVLDDPKVQRLNADDFRSWINLLCLASRNDGALPTADDIAFALRLDVKKVGNLLERLTKAGLIDVSETGMAPHGWSTRQYKSDVSTDRVQRFRKRKKDVASNGDETFHATPPETEADTEQSSVTNVTASDEKSADPEKVMFDSGVRLLGQAGHSPAKARSLLGKWKRDEGAAEVIASLGAAQREGAIDPVAFIEGRFRAKRRQPALDDTWSIGGTAMSSPC